MARDRAVRMRRAETRLTAAGSQKSCTGPLESASHSPTGVSSSWTSSMTRGSHPKLAQPLKQRRNARPGARERARVALDEEARRRAQLEGAPHPAQGLDLAAREGQLDDVDGAAGDGAVEAQGPGLGSESIQRSGTKRLLVRPSPSPR